MKTFKIDVTRTAFATKTYEVKAENEITAKWKACKMAQNDTFSEDFSDYSVSACEEEENDYIDRYGNPYDSEDDKACWPAGGGLHKHCEFNADALYAYYVVGDRVRIAEYLTAKGFRAEKGDEDYEVWAKGNTEVTYECYDKGANLWGYMHTELIIATE
jgi:hypothetical protein